MIYNLYIFNRKVGAVRSSAGRRNPTCFYKIWHTREKVCVENGNTPPPVLFKARFVPTYTQVQGDGRVVRKVGSHKDFLIFGSVEAPP